MSVGGRVVTGPSTWRNKATIVGGLFVFCVGTALLAWWLAKAPDERAESAGPRTANAAPLTRAASEALAGTEERPAVRAEALPEETPALVAGSVEPQAGQPEPHGIEITVRDLRHDLGKLRELKLYGTGDRIVRWATYLREDLLGLSYSMDEEIPKGFLDRHEAYTAVKGPNGGRVYSFTREDYPLFYEMMQRQPQQYEAVLEEELVERIRRFAEDAIALSGIPPE